MFGLAQLSGCPSSIYGTIIQELQTERTATDTDELQSQKPLVLHKFFKKIGFWSAKVSTEFSLHQVYP